MRGDFWQKTKFKERVSFCHKLMEIYSKLSNMSPPPYLTCKLRNILHDSCTTYSLQQGTNLCQPYFTYVHLTPNTILDISQIGHAALCARTHPCRPSGKITTPKLIFPPVRARYTHSFLTPSTLITS